jgi:hypothetical protein
VNLYFYLIISEKFWWDKYIWNSITLLLNTRGYVTELIKLYYETLTPWLCIFIQRPLQEVPKKFTLSTEKHCYCWNLLAPWWLVQHGEKYKSKQRRGTGKSSQPIYLLDFSPCPCAIAATNDLNAIKSFLFYKLSPMCIKLCGCW